MSMDHLLTLLRAAAEDTRLRILALAAREDLTVSDYVHVLGQSQPRVSRHLKLLVEAGLLAQQERLALRRWQPCNGALEPRKLLAHLGLSLRVVARVSLRLLDVGFLVVERDGVQVDTDAGRDRGNQQRPQRVS